MTVAELLIQSNVESLTRNGVLSTNVARDVRIYVEFRQYERAIHSGTMAKGDVYGVLAVQFDVAERTVRKALAAMCRQAIVPTSCQKAEISKN